LEGARRIDLEADLSSSGDPARGGRLPLPSLAAWGATLGRLGVTSDSDVVVYDDVGGANAAARAWWMLRAIGHERVAVLDGGMDAALGAGWPSSAEASSFSAVGAYGVPDAWGLPLVSVDEVDGARSDPSFRLLDARSAPRFRGEVEPIDPVAGHIPGAESFPYADQVADDGTFSSPDVLRERFERALGARQADQVIAYCGSGVTACHLLLGMAHAGLGIGTLYVGSWSEWCRQDRPRAP
jgi:thiosulfate/3-mercaptopyruvate sulfurtransferase